MKKLEEQALLKKVQSNGKKLDVIVRRLQNPTALTINKDVANIPPHLIKTFLTIQRLGKERNSSTIASITGRSRPTESRYLNELADLGYLSKRMATPERFGRPNALYKINQKPASTEYYDWLKNHPEKRNKLYEQGRNFEYSVMRKLRKHGFYCVRKFGSKGFEDVCAVKGGLVLLIQCKHSHWHDTTPNTMKEYERKGLIELANKHRVTAAFAGVKNRKTYFMIHNGRGWVNWKPS